MKKSFFDRIFPPSPGPSLPQFEQAEPLTWMSPRSSLSPPRIRLHENVPPSISKTYRHSNSPRPSSKASSRPESSERELQSAPLSASVLHHDDPFLPVERAARALQENIQSLLDAQSRALNGRAHGVEHDDIASGGSLTPTQSSFTPRSSTGMRTIPIRQPAKKIVGLRAARKGIARKMRDFADLRREELQILETESKARAHALARVEEFETRRKACSAEIASIRQENTSHRTADLRAEAKNVRSEIEELEHRLLELRVRHRHLLNQADQIESSQESKASSFQATISMIDREVRDFLRRPPISHSLANDTVSGKSGMYVLNPERRTLEMAREQWTSEQELLSQRTVEIENEHSALIEGEQIWSQSIKLINDFEKDLRAQTTQLKVDEEHDRQSSMGSILKELENVIGSLESDLALAESKSWNLLVCALGAELEAFYQARDLLQQTQQVSNGQMYTDHAHATTEHESQLPQDGGEYRNSSSPTGSTKSNQSLKDTLGEFSSQMHFATDGANSATNRYESDDDDPPDDFLLSR